MPLPSPTTTRAVKLKRRPPFTTLETRLMVTTRSRNWLLSESRLPRCWLGLRSRPPRRASRGSFLAGSVAAAVSTGATTSATSATAFSLLVVSSLTGSIHPLELPRRWPQRVLRSGYLHGQIRRRPHRPPWHARRRVRRPCGPLRSCHHRAHAGQSPWSRPTRGCDPCCRRRPARRRDGPSG